MGWNCNTESKQRNREWVCKVAWRAYKHCHSNVRTSYTRETSRIVNLHVQGLANKKYKVMDVHTVRQLMFGASVLHRIRLDNAQKYDADRVDRDFILSLFKKQDYRDVRDLLKNFWTTKFFGVSFNPKTLWSFEEKRAKKIVERTTKHKGNRWKSVFYAGLTSKTYPKVD